MKPPAKPREVPRKGGGCQKRRINMTTKFKILSAISFIALAIALTFVGVWAMTDLDFSVGGNITYTAPAQQGYTVFITHQKFAHFTGFNVNIYVNGELAGELTYEGKETYTFEDVNELTFTITNNPDRGTFYVGSISFREGSQTISITQDTTIYYYFDG